MMFWDKVSGLYDLFETIYNNKVYNETGKRVAEYLSSSDKVLECACGTGAISRYIAPACRQLIATDMSEGMLKQAKKKLSRYENVTVKKANLMKLKAKDNSFDAVVAGNVIHLLPDPKAAIEEMTRVCRDGGKLLIPTYINGSKGTSKMAVKALELLGANFKREFDAESYQEFFKNLGFENAAYDIVEGRMACDIAVITVDKSRT